MGLKEYLFGFKSEDKACEYLKKNGFEVIRRNFHSKFGEIDIIAKKDEILHFIEVKATNAEYEAVYRVTPKKLEKILKTVNFYLLKEGLEADFQVDVITIDKKSTKFIGNVTA
ncbi:YraN family protein [Campylobacter geochelonis]|uniref:UPF0102 protein ERS672216_00153 n=1 Tax=Campylobacter geochelonis TaxID=1780362 RepID=A0A128EC89_9BACT|nr:YraN family protein [Campylobacter geochelonis]QKF70568.1 UPF0102 domain-containing protein [Campylobacter geochelonis]CZE46018.1 Predicted endonuclease distantly related to archaeal Holliday junction resolvase [Campylobacter geochelonis]CZE46616.1 Predicted endonuclease distantly related to archaeal Holliday junction resolvase [Campylobacter geochelonis]